MSVLRVLTREEGTRRGALGPLVTVDERGIVIVSRLKDSKSGRWVVGRSPDSRGRERGKSEMEGSA